MLSESWDDKESDARLRGNLQRDLSRLLLSISSVPLPRIGSFRLDDSGYVELTNRPLTIQTIMHENEGIALHASRDATFSNVKAFVLSQLAAFDCRLLGQPNSVDSRDDALFQMASLAAAKSTLPQLFRQNFSDGPFVLNLTDLHKSNIFVNENWEITRIIDLEFACSLPVEFLEVPCWLHAEPSDGVIRAEEFAPRHAEFLEHLQREERRQEHPGLAEPISSVMEQAWNKGTFWATLALRSPVAFTGIFYDRILPNYFSVAVGQLNTADYSLTACMWRPNISDIVERKLADRDEYLKQLHQVFKDGS